MVRTSRQHGLTPPFLNLGAVMGNSLEAWYASYHTMQRTAAAGRAVSAMKEWRLACLRRFKGKQPMEEVTPEQQQERRRQLLRRRVETAREKYEQQHKEGRGSKRGAGSST